MKIEQERRGLHGLRRFFFELFSTLLQRNVEELVGSSHPINGVALIVEAFKVTTYV